MSNHHNGADQTVSKARLLEKLLKDMAVPAGLLPAFNDSSTTEIVLNGTNGTLWQHRIDGKKIKLGMMPASRAEAVLMTVAAYLNTTITAENSAIEGDFPLDGSRFSGQIPPTTPGPSFNIRKKASRNIRLLDYVNQSSLTQAQMQVIITAIEQHLNIVIVGGTASGKTTFLNAMIGAMTEIDPTERLVILEDTPEVQCSVDDFEKLKTSPTKTMSQLVAMTLRKSPDRILIGEVRGKEAWDMLKAWNTGHDGGICTVHANSATDGLTRLAQLVGEHSERPLSIENIVADFVQLLIFIEIVNQ